MAVPASRTEADRKDRRFQNPFAAPEEDEDPQCGMCGWRPTWLQLFSNMKVFMFCFVGLGVFHGMSHSYMGAVLPSIERRFGFTSTKLGTVKAMNDVSHILAALIIGHYGGSGHRPRWIAAGMFILGLAMLLYASPEFLFPVRSVSTAGKATVGGRFTSATEELCVLSKNSTTTPLPCTAAEHEEDNSGSLKTLIVLGVAEFFMGLGATTPMILGLPFVDDNVSYRSTPFYFALSFAGRLFGPLLGFGLGAVFNSIYFDFSHPHFQQTDPRWISAWYLGFIVCGLGVCLFAVTIGCFPAVLPTQKNISESVLFKENEKKHSPLHNHHGKLKQQPVNLKDLPRNLKRLLTNSTYMIKLGSQLLEGLAIAGYMGFSQKFITNQYGILPSISSLAGGVPPVFAGFVGIAIGSVLIKRLKFQPRHVSMMTVVAAITASVCYFSVLFMGCPNPTVIGLGVASQPSVLQRVETADSSCDVRNGCNCHSKLFSPVCDLLTNASYVSPCFAGCKSSKWSNQTRTKRKYFLNCACAANVTTFIDNSDDPSAMQEQLSQYPSQVVSGLCPSDCSNFIPYIIVMCIAKLFMGIPMAGVIMIQFRVVDYDLKSLANAVSSVVMSALGFLPAPIIAGYIIDSTCRFWQTSVCGRHGACLLYDVDAFRTKLHVSVGVCKLLAAALDVLVTYKLWNLNFEREEAPGETIILGTEMPTAFQILPERRASDESTDTFTATSEVNVHGEPAWEMKKSTSFGDRSEALSPSLSAGRREHQGLQKRTSFPIPPQG